MHSVQSDRAETRSDVLMTEKKKIIMLKFFIMKSGRNLPAFQGKVMSPFIGFLRYVG